MSITGKVVPGSGGDTYCITRVATDCYEQWTFVHVQRSEVSLTSYEQRASEHAEAVDRQYKDDAPSDLALADVPLPDEVVLELSRLRKLQGIVD